MASGSSDTWRILMVDDDEDDLLIVREILSQARGHKIALEWASTYLDGRQLLRTEVYDAVLVDYDLGEHTGIELVRETVDQGYPAPLILYTGRGSYEVDVEAMQAGASLYLTKGEVSSLSLERFIRYAIERKRAEEALKVAHEQAAHERNRLLAVMEALPVGVAIIDEKGGNVQSNHAFEEVWGNNRPEIHSIADYAPYQAWWVDSGLLVKTDEWASSQAIQKGETVVGQLIEIQRFDGPRAIVLNSGAPIRDAQGNITGSAVAIMDISEQRRLEIKQRDNLLQMEIHRRLLDYREKERQALARELHDGPVQDLSSLLFNIQFAKESIPDPAVRVELDQIALSLKNTVQNLRDMINEMRPPSLIRFGLAKAIQVFLAAYCEKHPEIDLQANLADDGDSLTEPGRLNLFRILQEALNNATNHSCATQIAVRLRCAGQQVVLEIQDKGCGFALPENLLEYSTKGHYGLAGMKERAEAIGGRLEIVSKPKKGTTIRVVVPVGK